MDLRNLEHEFLRPLCKAWLAKIEQARESRAKWKEIADDCLMFYGQSAQAMWDPSYAKKFWKNVKLPRFRITINKAFEMVAVFGPNLMWEVPHRKVEPKKPIPLPPELFGQDEQGQMMLQHMMMQQQAESGRDKLVAYLMDCWLNYTPREQPSGGLAGHAERAKVDALVKGRGILTTRPYRMPGSGRQLTGAFYTDPFDLFMDPDFKSVDECRWMAIRHIEPYYEVEERFQLPAGSLKNRAVSESSWMYSELLTDDQSAAKRSAGQTGDNIVWYEIYSKSGVGCRNTTVDSPIREHLEDVVGKYAYVAVCADVPYPLNMPSEKIRNSSVSDDDVRQAFQWPVPFWADDRWPCEFLDFYHNPQSSWPIAPLAPGLGELKLLNFLVSWLANRTWSSSRDFWAVAAPHVEHYRDYLMNGEDQAIIPTPLGVEEIDKAIKVLQQPETRQDMSRLIQFVSDMFDKRVGLTPFAYGLNQDGTQNRTAEETLAKSRAVSARPEFMQKQVVEWQSRIAQSEAFVTRWFVTGEDVRPLVGDVGAMLWDQVIVSTDVELVTRQFSYTIEAASIRRPNRERDIANYQQVAALWLPIVQQYGATTGNYEPFNFLMRKWAEYHDADLSGAEIPPPEPPSEEEQAMMQASQELELQKLQAEIEKTLAEAAAKRVDAESGEAEAMADAQREAIKLEMEAERQALKMRSDAEKAEQDMQIKREVSLLDMLQGAAEHEQEMEQDREKHLQDMLITRQMATQKIAAQRAIQRAKPKAVGAK